LASPRLNPRWIIRIVVGLVLVTVLIIAFMDFKAKGDAQKTTDAWIALMKSDSGAVALDDFTDSLVGSPVIETTDDEALGETHRDYIWQGTFRSYRTRVSLMSQSQYVNSVEGPFNE